MSISIVLTITTLKTGRDTGIFIPKTCVNISAKDKNAPMVINAPILILESNSFISIKRIKRNFARTILLTSKSVNMGIFAHLPIMKIKLGSNSYTIMSSMKISICFIIRLSSVHLT